MRHGKLVGSIQQPIEEMEFEGEEGERGEVERKQRARSQKPQEWWAIGTLCEKEGEEEGVRWEEFTSKKEANTAWKNLVQNIGGKAGRAALLVNCMTRKEVSRTGRAEEVDRLSESGHEKGFCCSKDEELDEVSLLQTTMMLYKVLNTKRDTLFMLFVMMLLCISMVFGLESEMLMGKVLVLASNPSNQSWLLEGWYVATSCSLVACSTEEGELVADLRIRLILALIGVHLVERFFYLGNVFLHHNACEGRNLRMRVCPFSLILYFKK